MIKEWPVQKIAVEKIQPAEYNPRPDLQPTDKVYRQLKKSLEKFGLADQIVWNKRTGNLVGGHQRLKILKESGAKQIPCTVVDLSLKDEKAMNLALNNIQSHNDQEKLKDIAFDLVQSGFDMDSVGFDAVALDDIFETEPEKQDLKLFSDDQIRDQIIEHWAKYMPENPVLAAISPHVAMAQFNRLASGMDDGYWISALFNPQRLSTTTKKCKKNYLDALTGKYEVFIRDCARFISTYTPDTPYHQFIKQAVVGVAGIQCCYEFKPWIARDLYKKYAKDGARVLDPCHGWGGRVIGWLSTNFKGEYIGYDPAQQTNQGVRKLIEFLKQSSTQSKAFARCQPFEEAKVERDSFDYALTSPPYFDIEHYADGAHGQSYTSYPTYEEWREKFLKLMIQKTMYCLKKGGVFTINVGVNVYDLRNDVIEISKELGFNVTEETQFQIGGNGIGERASVEGSSIKGEPFLTISKE